MKTTFLCTVVAFLLSSFTVTANDNLEYGKVSIETNADASKVLINWELNNGIDADYFEIERSFDQVNFQTAGIVLDALATKNGSRLFRFKDNSVVLKEHNKVYYRLKRISANKTATTSKVINIDFTSVRQVEIEAQAFANHNLVNIGFESKKNGTADVLIYNAAHQLIAQSTYEVEKGSNMLEIAHMANFPDGTYNVNIVLKGNSLASHKVVIR